jgi:hypothetical protein
VFGIGLLMHDPALNKLILCSKAEIYECDGDEALLTWRIKDYNIVFINPFICFLTPKEGGKERCLC